jgi:predicted RNase H-like nuclease (RuvC/YqgF family)
VATIEELFKQFDALAAKVENRDVRKELVTWARSLRSAVQALETQQTELEGRVAEQEKEIAALKEHAAQLTSEATTSARPLDLARSFRDVIDTIQADARQAEEVGVTIRSMDVEIKGLVEATEKETTLVLPSTGAPIDPNALSTLRVSFSAVPSARIDEPPVEPPR